MRDRDRTHQYTRSTLRRAGLLNEEGYTLGPDVEFKRKLSKAYCTSDECAGKRERVLKNVPLTADVCPDCGSYLWWGSNDRFRE